MLRTPTRPESAALPRRQSDPGPRPSWWRLRDNRMPLPDAWRGCAILSMALYHGWYNLSVFGVVAMDTQSLFWVTFRAFIVTLFCLVAGAGMRWSHARGIRWRTWARRQAQLLVAALGVSLVTAWLYPDAWVWFGILQFFLVAFTLSLPLVRMPHMALAAGIVLILAERLQLPLTEPWVGELAHRHLPLPDTTLDRAYLLPWLGVFWLGLGLAGHPAWQLRLPQNPGIRCLRWIGQHPLSIYLLHQPLLFSLAYLLFGQ